MPYFAFLAAAIVPLAKKLLLGIGIGMIIYSGLEPIKAELNVMVQQQFDSMGQNVYAICALAGFVDAAGIWLGAISSVMSMMAYRRIGMLARMIR